MIFQLIFIGVIACQAPHAIEPEIAQQDLQKAWKANQHTVWEINWPTAPIGGVIVVEYWQFDNQYRFEILESTSTRLVGETLISNGNSICRYNRFELFELDEISLVETTSSQLSPVTDLFSMIDRLLHYSTSLSAQQQVTSTLEGASKKIELLLADQTRLIFWLDVKTKLPLRIELITARENILLKAQSNKPLIRPPQGLFSRPIIH
ncbi:hypothetical protein QUF58_01355 [Anaerolineales bacterium HSG24]|nr:hypothetical protein [Anaerolineales bacterium HSG24]